MLAACWPYISIGEMISALRHLFGSATSDGSRPPSARQLKAQAEEWHKLSLDCWAESAALTSRLVCVVAEAEEKLLLLLRWGMLDAVHPFLKLSHLKVQHVAIKVNLYRHTAILCRRHELACKGLAAGDQTAAVSISPAKQQLTADETVHRIRMRLKHCESALKRLSSSVVQDMTVLSGSAPLAQPLLLAGRLESAMMQTPQIHLLLDGGMSPRADVSSLQLTDSELGTLRNACKYLVSSLDANTAKEVADRSRLSDSIYIRSNETTRLQHIDSAAWYTVGSSDTTAAVAVRAHSLPVHSQVQAQPGCMNIHLVSGPSGVWKHCVLFDAPLLGEMQQTMQSTARLRAELGGVFMDRRCQWGKLVAAWSRRVIGYDPVSAAWWARLQAVLRIDTAHTGVALPDLHVAQSAALPSPQHDSPAVRARAGSSSAVPELQSGGPVASVPPQRLPLPRTRSRNRHSTSCTAQLSDVHLQAAAWGMFHRDIAKELGCDMLGIPTSDTLPRPKLVNAFAKWLCKEISKESPAVLQQVLSESSSASATSADDWIRQKLLPVVQWELFSRLHALLFATGQVQWLPQASGGFARIRAADGRWRRKAPIVARLTPAQLGVKESILPQECAQDKDLFAMPRLLLAVSETLMSPDDMLSCMCCAVECMFLELRLRHGGQSCEVAADDLAPLLMFLLSHSCMSQPHAALAFVGTYALGGTASHATGHQGYILVSLQMAISAVLQHDAQDTESPPSGQADGAAAEGGSAPAQSPSLPPSKVPHGAAVDSMDADEALMRLESGRLHAPNTIPGADHAHVDTSTTAVAPDAAAEEEEVTVWDALGAQVRGGEAASADREGIQEMGEWIGDHKVVQETLVLFS